LSCNHKALFLLDPPGEKLRCRYCHLTIDKMELTEGYCPECHDREGVRRIDFESIEPEIDEKTLYRCEKCGILIEV